MGSPVPETDHDRAAWARLWQIAREPWERTDDLATVLGVSRAAVVQWCTGYQGRTGPWTLLRGALRQGARRHPETIARVVQALAAELLDARGRWVPEETEPVGPYTEESADVVDALAELRAATRGSDRTAITAAATRLVREAEEAARAATAEA